MFQLNQGNLKAAGLSKPTYQRKPASRASLLAGHLDDILNNPEKYVDVVPISVETALRRQMMSNNQRRRLSSLSPIARKYFERVGVGQNIRRNTQNTRKTSRQEINKHTHNLTSVLMRLQTNDKKQRKLLIAEKLARSKDTSNRKSLSLFRQVQQAKALLANLPEQFNDLYDPIVIVGSNVNQLKRLGLLNESNNAVLRKMGFRPVK